MSIHKDARDIRRCRCGILFALHSDRAMSIITDSHEPVEMRCESCDEPIEHLPLFICGMDEDHYCIEHCPGHEWVSDYDEPIICQLCGMDYMSYLENLLTEHGIEYRVNGGA